MLASVPVVRREWDRKWEYPCGFDGLEIMMGENKQLIFKKDKTLNSKGGTNYFGGTSLGENGRRFHPQPCTVVRNLGQQSHRMEGLHFHIAKLTW